MGKKKLAWKRGWAFLRQSWEMLQNDWDLIKPSVLALLAGLGLGIVSLAPMVWLAFSTGGEPSAMLGVVFGAVLAFTQYLTAYIFSAMTAYLVYGYLAEGDGRMDRAWAIVRRDLGDLAKLAAVSLGMYLLRQLLSRTRGGTKTLTAIQRILPAFLGALWEETAALLVPIMVIDDLPLTKGLERLYHITRENLLQVSIGAIGVRAVSAALVFLGGVLGGGAGVLFGWFLVYVTGGQAAGWGLSIVSGLALFGLGLAVGIVFSTYFRTAYYTSLYLWARALERTGRKDAAAARALAPRPLASALEVV